MVRVEGNGGVTLMGQPVGDLMISRKSDNMFFSQKKLSKEMNERQKEFRSYSNNSSLLLSP